MIVPSPTAPLLSLPANWFVVRSASLPLKSNPFLSPFPSFLLFFECGEGEGGTGGPPSGANALPKGEN